MPRGEVAVKLLDGGLGAVGSASAPVCKIGTSSKGALNTVLAFGTPEEVRDTLGEGPLVDALILGLLRGGGPVYGVRVTATTAGASGAVTHTPKDNGDAGPSPGAAPAANGSYPGPFDQYDVIVEILKSGAVGTSTFRVSVDGGDTWSQTYATTATFSTLASKYGFNITFAAGTYKIGDRYTWSTTAPAYAAGELNTALDAIKAQTTVFDHIHIVGTVTGVDDAAKVAAFVALFGAIDAKMTEFENAYRYTYALMEVPVVADAALQVASFQNLLSARIATTGGDLELTSPSTQRIERRHAGSLVSARIARAALNEDPASGVTLGGDVGTVVQLFRDDRKTPGFVDLRIIGLRTYEGTPGVYTTEGKTMAAPGSDYSDLPNRRVMDRAAATARLAMLGLLHAALPVNATTGRILEKRARQIEEALKARIEAVVGPFVSSVSVQFNRTDNILSSKKFRVKVAIIPNALGREVEVSIGFVNPALQVV